MTEYNKLVRDNIPDIISANGETPVTRILSDSEYELELIRKVGEEARELAKADTTEAVLSEAGDVMDALEALVRHISSVREFQEQRARKIQERGGFDKRIFLERTE